MSHLGGALFAFVIQAIRRCRETRATVVGIILIGLGTLLLAYFASPVRLLFQATLEQHKINPVPPILGG